MNASVKPQSVRKDAVYVYSAYALRYLSVFILIPYYGRVLGPASYGVVLAATSLMAVVWMIVNYGFSPIGTREMALTTGEAGHAAIFGQQIAARLILIPLGAIVGAIGTAISPSLRANPWYGVIATLLGLINAMNLGWFFQGLRRFRLSLLYEAMAYPLNIAFVLLLVKNANDGLNALLALLAATSIATVLAYLNAVRTVKPQPITLAGGIKEIKGASILFFQSVNAMLMTAGSTYLLSIFSTPEQVGYFGSVERLIYFALAFLQPAAQVLMPTIAQRSKHASQDAHRLVRNGILFELGYGVTACLGGLLLAPYIIPLAFGQRFVPSIHLMRIMVWALPFAAFTHAVGSYVVIPQKNERWLFVAFLVGNTCNVALIVVLAPSLEGVGVSIARVVGEFLTAATLTYLALSRQWNRTSLVGQPPS